MTIITRTPIDDWCLVTVDTPKGECLITQWSSMTDDDVLKAAALWASEVDHGVEKASYTAD